MDALLDQQLQRQHDHLHREVEALKRDMHLIGRALADLQRIVLGIAEKQPEPVGTNGSAEAAG